MFLHIGVKAMKCQSLQVFYGMMCVCVCSGLVSSRQPAINCLGLCLCTTVALLYADNCVILASEKRQQLSGFCGE